MRTVGQPHHRPWRARLNRGWYTPLINDTQAERRRPRLARAVGKAMWEEFRGHFDADKGGAEGRFGGEEAELDSGRGDSPSSPYDPAMHSLQKPAGRLCLSRLRARRQCWDCSAMSSGLGTGNAEPAVAKELRLVRSVWKCGIRKRMFHNLSLQYVPTPERSCCESCIVYIARLLWVCVCSLSYILLKTIEEVLVPGRYSRWFGALSEEL